MAAAKAATRSPASLTLADRLATEYNDVVIALSKARAASILLRATDDYLQIPVYLRAGEDEKTIRDWIKSIAEDALDDALAEAEAAFCKTSGGGA